MLEWTSLQQDLVTRMAGVAVPRHVVNRADLFRGNLEFETGEQFHYQRVPTAEAVSVPYGQVPMEIRQLYNAIKGWDLLVGMNGCRGCYFIQCRRAGKHFLLKLQPVSLEEVVR